MDSLKASVLTAFYTPAPVIDAIASSLKGNGVVVKEFSGTVSRARGIH